MEWLKLFYEHFGASHPKLSTIAVFIIFGTFFALLWFAIGKSYEKSLFESQTKQKEDLKVRAKNLSKEILEFIADRERSGFRLPRKETWDLDTELMIREHTETMSQYSTKFGSRVIAVRDELAKNGLKDKELDSFYEHPTNAIGIRIVGERIGALAEKL